MVSSRMIARGLEAAPIAVVAALAAWSLWDFLGIPNAGHLQALTAVLLLGLGGLVLGVRFDFPAIRRGGLVLVAVSYLGAHLFLLPLDPAAAVGFLTLVFVAVELRVLAERFAPVFRVELGAKERGRSEEALARMVLRIAAAAAIGFFGATLTADLSLSGTVPVRTIPTALLLSMGFIAVILLLAFWPILEQRRPAPRARAPRIQTPK